MSGLRNIGNTCFINAVVQCLNALPELNTWLDTYDKDNILVKEYNDLRILMKEEGGIIPNRFIFVVFSNSPFKRYDQHDASEFLLYMLDSFQCPLFTGKQSSILGNTKMEEFFLCIDVPISGNTLHDCIEAYLSVEEVEWNGNKVSKRYEILEYPSLLCINLKRFNNAGEKNQTFIDIPLEYKDYELAAICNHYGNSQHGHYTAVVKRGQWYEINDEHIKEVQPITNNAYCLIFRRLEGNI
jgi:ubiquitin C-terminal hydrolase